MNIFLRALITTALLLLSSRSMACSLLHYSSQEKFQKNSVVVLAYPIAIANEPSNALASTFQGPFKQRVQWQVLVSWKGRYRPGDVFITWVPYQTSACGDGAIRQKAIRLLFLHGQEPYREMINSLPEDSISDMKYLGRLRHDG